MISATSSNNGAKREEPERKTGLVNQDTGPEETLKHKILGIQRRWPIEAD